MLNEEIMSNTRLIIVGGVAGGASAAARARRLCEDCEIITYCHSGQRSYIAARVLSHHGFRVRNLTGSYRTWRATQCQ